MDQCTISARPAGVPIVESRRATMSLHDSDNAAVTPVGDADRSSASRARTRTSRGQPWPPAFPQSG